MYTIIKHNGHEIEVVPTASGYFCRWDSGETYTVQSESAAVFLADNQFARALRSPSRISLIYCAAQLPPGCGIPTFRDLFS